MSRQHKQQPASFSPIHPGTRYGSGSPARVQPGGKSRGRRLKVAGQSFAADFGWGETSEVSCLGEEKFLYRCDVKGRGRFSTTESLRTSSTDSVWNCREECILGGKIFLA